MRRLAAIAILIALLIVIPTAPALAYKRKRTVAVGIDSDGVPVKIDLEVSGNETTGARSRGGGGAPCTYVPASVGLEELYRQQGANLFSVTCGSYTDVRLLRTGPDGQPLLPGPTVDPFQLALSARDRLPVPQG
jgi:hypothetical protein